MKIWTRCDTLALLLNCIATEEFWGWIFISWIENQISWTFCDCGVSPAGPGFSDSITFDTVIFDTITFDTITFDTKHFVPPFHFSFVGKHWQFQFGILTLNARDGPWQNPMCVFQPCSKAMSFWHWLHLKKFPIPPLHLSAGWASKQQFVEFDVSRGVCLCILTANARLKLWAFQKCSHTAAAQAGKMWNCHLLLLN